MDDMEGMDHTMEGMDRTMVGMDMNNGSHHMMMMKMYFHTGFGDTLFFKEWVINSASDLIGAFFGLLFLGLVYEAIKVLREHHLFRHIRSQPSISSIAIESQRGAISNFNTVREPMSKTRRMCSFGHILQCLLYMLQVAISYLLMLAFMTYNLWICLAVVLGAGIGHFIFGWYRAVISQDLINDDHCS